MSKKKLKKETKDCPCNKTKDYFKKETIKAEKQLETVTREINRRCFDRRSSRLKHSRVRSSGTLHGEERKKEICQKAKD